MIWVLGLSWPLLHGRGFFVPCLGYFLLTNVKVLDNVIQLYYLWSIE